MRTWMVVLLAISCIDFTIKFSNGYKINLSWFIRILALILFCTNF